MTMRNETGAMQAETARQNWAQSVAAPMHVLGGMALLTAAAIAIGPDHVGTLTQTFSNLPSSEALAFSHKTHVFPAAVAVGSLSLCAGVALWRNARSFCERLKNNKNVARGVNLLTGLAVAGWSGIAVLGHSVATKLESFTAPDAQGLSIAAAVVSLGAIGGAVSTVLAGRKAKAASLRL